MQVRFADGTCAEAVPAIEAKSAAPRRAAIEALVNLRVVIGQAPVCRYPSSVDEISCERL